MKRTFTSHFNVYWLLLLLILSVASCTKKAKPTEASVVADGLQLCGHLVLPDATAAKDAKIFLPGVPEPLTTSDDQGAFALSMTPAQIAAIKSLHLDSSGTSFLNDFQLYFEIGSGATMLNSASGFIYGAAGPASRDLGTIRLDRPGVIGGAVNLIDAGGNPTPTANVTVASDHAATQSDKNGIFSLAGLPSGPIRLYVFNNDTSIATVEATIAAGSVTTLDFPLKAWSKNAVDGQLIAVRNANKSLQPGLPDQLNFSVMRTSNVRYIRYAHNQSSVASADWQEVADLVSYNFPQSGANVLYYQFADVGKTALSRVLSASVAADPFADSTGITINDGGGTAATRHVTVHIDVPAAAISMRLSENQDDLSTDSPLPFIKSQATYEYSLAVLQTIDGQDNSQAPTAKRTIYCQFKAADGSVSHAFTATISLVPFKSDLTDKTAFTLGDGSGSNGGLFVPVKVNLPDNAYEMRMWEENDITLDISGDSVIVVGQRVQIQNTWFLATKSLSFNFKSNGWKNVYLQFRTVDGLTSPVFKQEIIVYYLASVDRGFTINGGATVSTSREVTLQLTPPSNGSFFRVSEDPIGIVNVVLSHLPADKQVHFLAGGVGLRTIYLNYFDDAGNAGAPFVESIIVDPFDHDPGNYAFADVTNNPLPVSPLANIGPLPVTTDPNITLLIQPPESVVPDGQMEVIKANISLQGVPVCAPLQVVNSFIPIATQFHFYLNTTGPTTLCVRFKTVEGDTGPYIMQTVNYDPFFPPTAGAVAIIKHENNVINTRNPKLSLLIPPRSYQWKIVLATASDSAAALAAAPLLDLPAPPSPDGITITSPIPFVSPGPYGDDTNYQVFVQFFDQNGDPSHVYSDRAVLNLLFANLTIASRGTNTTLLNVDITPPTKMVTALKIAMSDAAIASATPLPISDQMQFTVNQTSGSATLSFQYVTSDGSNQTIFHSTIDLSP